MEMTVKEVLIAARAKIADPANWTQGECARDSTGKEVHSSSDRAVCWCSIGAIANTIALDGGVFNNVITELEFVIPGGISTFNDTHTHAEVLAKFDEAIAAQGGE